MQARTSILCIGVCVILAAFAHNGAPQEIAKLLPPAPQTLPGFGIATAIGDGILVIGNPGHSEFGEESGAVHAYLSTTSLPMPLPILFPSDSVPGLAFGRRVAAHNNRVAITSELRAYIFRFEAGQWIQEVAIPFKSFAVALDSDDVAVGVPTGSGSVVVYHLDSGFDSVSTRDDTWVEDSWLNGPGGAFGQSVSIDGDRMVVGAPLGMQNGTKTGVAYVFERQMRGGPFTQVARLEPTNASDGVQFGYSVSIKNDLILVGAPDNNAGLGSSGGAAYVYRRSALDASWQSEARLVARSNAGDTFGISVAIGDKSLFIGASLADLPGLQDIGAVYQFKRRRNSLGSPQWRLTSRTSIADAQESDFFGNSMAYRDGTLLIGAPGVSPDGSAYLFSAK